jgi:hypothetical protein
MKGKYIVIAGQTIIIFSETQVHLEMAERVARPGIITSAGFITTDVTPEGRLSVSCYGTSTSLKKDSDPENDERLARYAIGAQL